MNRPFQKILLVLLVMVMVYSCAVFDVSYSKNPRKIAEKFLKELYSGEYKKAKKLGTHKTQQILDMMDQLIVISGQKGFPTDSKVEVLDCKISGDSAKCNYLLSGKDSEIDLIKSENKWLVDLKKEGKGQPQKNNFLNDHINNDKDNKK